MAIALRSVAISEPVRPAPFSDQKIDIPSLNLHQPRSSQPVVERIEDDAVHVEAQRRAECPEHASECIVLRSRRSTSEG